MRCARRRDGSSTTGAALRAARRLRSRKNVQSDKHATPSEAEMRSDAGLQRQTYDGFGMSAGLGSTAMYRLYGEIARESFDSGDHSEPSD